VYRVWNTYRSDTPALAVAEVEKVSKLTVRLKVEGGDNQAGFRYRLRWSPEALVTTPEKAWLKYIEDTEFGLKDLKEQVRHTATRLEVANRELLKATRARR